MGDPIHSSRCHLERGRYSLFLKAVGYSGLTRSQQLTEDFHQFGKHLKLGRLLKSNNLFGSRVSSWSKPRPRPQSKTGPFAGSVHGSHSNNRFPCARHCIEGIRSTRRERNQEKGVSFFKRVKKELKKQNVSVKSQFQGILLNPFFVMPKSSTALGT